MNSSLLGYIDLAYSSQARVNRPEEDSELSKIKKKLREDIKSKISKYKAG
jgi:hypothetical protein